MQKPVLLLHIIYRAYTFYCNYHLFIGWTDELRTGRLALVMVVWKSSSHVWWAWCSDGQGKSTQTPTHTLSWRTGRGLDSCLQFRLCICVPGGEEQGSRWLREAHCYSSKLHVLEKQPTITLNKS